MVNISNLSFPKKAKICGGKRAHRHIYIYLSLYISLSLFLSLSMSFASDPLSFFPFSPLSPPLTLSFMTSSLSALCTHVLLFHLSGLLKQVLLVVVVLLLLLLLLPGRPSSQQLLLQLLHPLLGKVSLTL